MPDEPPPFAATPRGTGAGRRRSFGEATRSQPRSRLPVWELRSASTTGGAALSETFGRGREYRGKETLGSATPAIVHSNSRTLTHGIGPRTWRALLGTGFAAARRAMTPLSLIWLLLSVLGGRTKQRRASRRGVTSLGGSGHDRRRSSSQARSRRPPTTTPRRRPAEAPPDPPRPTS